jgi:deoxycytidylate deaminase
MIDPFSAMQRAVDIVQTSPHPDNKIAASLFRGELITARTNAWPEKIVRLLGTTTRIGSSSGTVHAEVSCLLNFPGKVEGASLCITDPFCPNCAKNIAEAGVKRIYIDHKGFQKDFAKRRSGEFESMSLRIAERAGIEIFELRRKERSIIPILEIRDGFRAPQDNPIKIEKSPFDAGPRGLRELVDSVQVLHERWACGFAMGDQRQLYALIASAHPAIGYTKENPGDLDALSHPEGKYNFYLEPVNRLLMGAARNGMRLLDGLVWCSVVPTSREQVNLVAANIGTIHIGATNEARDADALAARDTLSTADILSFVDNPTIR